MLDGRYDNISSVRVIYATRTTGPYMLQGYYKTCCYTLVSCVRSGLFYHELKLLYTLQDKRIKEEYSAAQKVNVNTGETVAACAGLRYLLTRSAWRCVGLNILSWEVVYHRALEAAVNKVLAELPAAGGFFQDLRVCGNSNREFQLVHSLCS